MKNFPKILRLIIKILLIGVLAFIVISIGFLIYSTIRDYKPAPVASVDVVKTKQGSEIFQTDFSVLTWNVGYCGLGKEMDAASEGGKKMRPADADFQRYLNGVYNLIGRHDSIDFILLQEVDTSARRSYYTNQADLFREDLPEHASVYASNYKVDFVPRPFTNPMGKVESGLMSFSRFAPSQAQRYAFPLNYSWPTRLFMPDRCFIAERFTLSNGKELVIVNTHNSAFEDAERMRFYELWMLRSLLLNEYGKGNYVIAGGDWNQSPAGYNNKAYKDKSPKRPVTDLIEKNFLPADWHWAFDPDHPTNRDVSAPYAKGVTLTQTLDYFLVSPNLRIDHVAVVPAGFEFSDHQPVYMKLHIIEDPMQMIPDELAGVMRTLQDSVKMLKEQLGKSKDRQETRKPDRFYQRK